MMRQTRFLKLGDDDEESAVGRQSLRLARSSVQDEEEITVNFHEIDLNRNSPLEIGTPNSNSSYSSSSGLGGYGNIMRSGASLSPMEQEKRKSLLKGALLVGAFCVLPLFIIMIALSSVLNAQNNSSGSSSSTPTSFSWDVYEASATSLKGAVATDNPTCSQIGLSVLQQGGNAVEAAIASAFCLGVISPASSGVGGGCFLLIRNATSGVSEFIDAREVAPAAATPDMFVSDPLLAQNGGLAVATLGEVKGLEVAFERYKSGRVKWRDLVLPAAKLAEEWTISPEFSLYIKKVETYLLSGNFTYLSNLYMKNGLKDLKKAGDTVQQPELSSTLKQIASHGSDYLYKTMAKVLASEVQAMGGVLTAQDIESYEPTIREPIVTDIAGFTYIGVGGSSSGGAVVAGILKFMNAIPQPVVSLGYEYYYWLAEAMKHTFAMRLSLGDSDYVNTTLVLQALLSDSYMASLQALSQPDHVLDTKQYGGKFNVTYYTEEDHGTSHLSVLDAFGLSVAMTTTVNTEFGSKVISPSTGILFNNQMDDFSIPNASNYFDLSPSPFNFPAPYKKPLSSMSPSMLLDRKGRVVLIGGASGGPRIITATAQVILNYLWRGKDLLSSLISPRIHTQFLPVHIDVEHQSLVNGQSIEGGMEVLHILKERGNAGVVYYNGSFGVSQFIGVEYNEGHGEGEKVKVVAVSDPRKEGKPAVWV